MPCETTWTDRPRTRIPDEEVDRTYVRGVRRSLLRYAAAHGAASIQNGENIYPLPNRLRTAPRGVCRLSHRRLSGIFLCRQRLSRDIAVPIWHPFRQNRTRISPSAFPYALSRTAAQPQASPVAVGADLVSRRRSFQTTCGSHDGFGKRLRPVARSRRRWTDAVADTSDGAMHAVEDLERTVGVHRARIGISDHEASANNARASGSEARISRSSGERSARPMTTAFHFRPGTGEGQGVDRDRFSLVHATVGSVNRSPEPIEQSASLSRSSAGAWQPSTLRFCASTEALQVFGVRKGVWQNDGARRNRHESSMNIRPSNAYPRRENLHTPLRTSAC